MEESISILEEVEALWGKVSMDAGIDRPFEPVSKAIHEFRLESTIQAGKHFSKHLLLLDLGIDWLACLSMSIDERIEKEVIQSRSPELFSIKLLAGTACNHSVAVRHLVTGGLDSSARIVLRTLIETLLRCIVLIDDENLRKNFSEADDSSEFWHQNFSDKKLSNHIKRIEKKYGIGSELTSTTERWRQNIHSNLSGFVHGSHIPNFLSFYAKSPDDPRNYKIGLLGMCNANSSFTLREAIGWIWYFTMLSGRLLFVDGLHKLDMANDTDQQLWIETYVFNELFLRHWDSLLPENLE